MKLLEENNANLDCANYGINTTNTNGRMFAGIQTIFYKIKLKRQVRELKYVLDLTKSFREINGTKESK